MWKTCLGKSKLCIFLDYTNHNYPAFSDLRFHAAFKHLLRHFPLASSIKTKFFENPLEHFNMLHICKSRLFRCFGAFRCFICESTLVSFSNKD